jgi:signal transduction histidine kinase
LGSSAYGRPWTSACPALAGANPGLPIASYAVARYDDRRVRQWALLAAGSASVLRPWSIDTFEVAGERAFAAGFLVLLPAALGAYSRARAMLMAALVERAERAEAQQELLARKAVLGERARIAREMHDVVGHRVGLMVLQSGAIEMAAADPGKVAQLAG